MLDHIPAGVDPSGDKAFFQIEGNRDALHLNAADEHAALVEGVADYVKQVIRQHTDVRSTDIAYKVESESFGVGRLVLSVPEEMPALPELVTEAIKEFRGEEYFDLRAEGYDISPDYDMPEDDYKYVFHYGG